MTLDGLDYGVATPSNELFNGQEMRSCQNISQVSLILLWPSTPSLTAFSSRSIPLRFAVSWPPPAAPRPAGRHSQEGGGRRGRGGDALFVSQDEVPWGLPLHTEFLPLAGLTRYGAVTRLWSMLPTSESLPRPLSSRNSVIGSVYLYALSSNGSFTSKWFIY